jgi:hypothetical protein
MQDIQNKFQEQYLCMLQAKYKAKSPAEYETYNVHILPRHIMQYLTLNTEPLNTSSTSTDMFVLLLLDSLRLEGNYTNHLF